MVFSQFQGDGAHAGLAASPGPTTDAVSWTTPTSPGTGGITVSGPYLLVTEAGGDGAPGGPPIVLDASNGTVASQLPSQSLGTGFAPVSGAMTYFESYTCGALSCACNLLAEWLSNGTTVWNDTVECSPTLASDFGYASISVDDGLVFFVQQGFNELTAYSATNGSTVWSIQLPVEVAGTVSVGDGLVVLGYCDADILSAYNEATGSPAWTLPINGTLSSDLVGVGYGIAANTPAYSNGVFYFGTQGGNAYAVDANGTVRWNVGTGAAFDATPAIDGDLVIEANTAGEILALNATDGLTEWSYALGSPIVASPAISTNGIVYVAGGYYGGLVALNESTGSVIWITAQPGLILTGPVLAGGGLFVLTLNGTVWAYGAPPPRLYPVTFTAKSLASPGQHWSVSLGDRTLDRTGPTSATFHVANGTYPYAIWDSHGSVVAGISPAGNLSVDGPSVTIHGQPLVPFRFVHGTTYRISFVESGLWKHRTWCASIVGSKCTDRRTLSFQWLTPGEYPYSIAPQTGEILTVYLNGVEVPASGWVDVTSHVRFVVRFTSEFGSSLGAPLDLDSHGAIPPDLATESIGRVPHVIVVPPLVVAREDRPGS